jgi:homospermidine synthase
MRKKFNGKILVIGCGSVAQCLIPLLLKMIDMPSSKITIMDFVDNRRRIKDALRRGVNYVIDRIAPENYSKLLSKYVGRGDLIIDLAWNIDCGVMLTWCRQHDVLYANTSLEEWDPYGDEDREDPRRYTLYTRHMELREITDPWVANPGATAIIDHGANPGLVSHFTKQALVQITEKILNEKPRDKRRRLLVEALDDKNFAKLSQLTGVKTIHVSERDSQITDKPKQVNEFVNTWSIEGFYEEGVAPAELGWGTHERLIPGGAYFYDQGPKNQICLNTVGMKTWVRSWVPSGEITGMVIRHGEAFSISDRLTVWERGVPVYRPTVHYAYCPSDVAINSMHELEMRQFYLQEKQRIMNDEIISGKDELGVLLMGHDFNSWWCGSCLSIQDARKLVPGQQATTLQVAISIMAAVIWMIDNPRKGFLMPDDVDHEPILKIAKPYIKPIFSQAVDWTPFKNANIKYIKFNIPQPKPEDVWQFTTFLIHHQERLSAHERRNGSSARSLAVSR